MIDRDPCSDKKYSTGGDQCPEKSFFSISIRKFSVCSLGRAFEPDEEKGLIECICDAMDSL